MDINLIPIEIWQIILNLNDIKSQLMMRMVCELFYKLNIYDLLNIPKKFKRKLTNNIISQHINLRYLYAGKHTKITQEKINILNLYELNANNNLNIYNINHMNNLEKLKACGHSGIGNKGIKNVNLKNLHISYNMNICNLNHMTNLKKLYVRNSGIGDIGIKKLNLKKLDCRNNRYITNVNHMSNLKSLIDDKIRKVKIHKKIVNL